MGGGGPKPPSFPPFLVEPRRSFCLALQETTLRRALAARTRCGPLGKAPPSAGFILSGGLGAPPCWPLMSTGDANSAAITDGPGAAGLGLCDQRAEEELFRASGPTAVPGCHVGTRGILASGPQLAGMG